MDELPPMPRRRVGAEPEDIVEYDLDDWASEQREGLDLRPRGLEIPTEWLGTSLRVPINAETEVDALVDMVDAGADVGLEPLPDTPEASQSSVADPWRRFFGALIDGVIISPFGFALRPSIGVWGVIAVTTAYNIVCVGLWGRTIGKRAVGTLVVSTDSNMIPDWRSAAIRGVVPIVDRIVFVFLPSWDWLGVLGLVWLIAVYGPILRSPTRQGLHDRAAGTVVIYR